MDTSYQLIEDGRFLLERMRQHETRGEVVCSAPPCVIRAIRAALEAMPVKDEDDVRLKQNLDVLTRMAERQRAVMAEREEAWLDPETHLPRGGIPNRYGGIPNRYAR
jgi:hypothetical protein